MLIYIFLTKPGPALISKHFGSIIRVESPSRLPEDINLTFELENITITEQDVKDHYLR